MSSLPQVQGRVQAEEKHRGKMSFPSPALELKWSLLPLASVSQAIWLLDSTD